MTRQEQLCKWLQTLTPREEQVLRARFGIGVEASAFRRLSAFNMTLTAQEIQQLECQGLRRLRTSPLTETFGHARSYASQW